MQEKKKKRSWVSSKNVVTVWNNLSIGKKIGSAVLLVFLWLLYLDEWLEIGDIIDGLL